MALFDIMNAIAPGTTVTPADADYLPCFDVSAGKAGKVLVSALSTKVVSDNSIYLPHQIVDISTAASSWLVSPIAGTIDKVWSVIDGTIATANAVITFELGGTAITGGTITVAYSGSAAGDVDTCTPTALNTVAADGAIEVVNAGASTNTVICNLIFKITPS